jgi:dihydrofolate reductase
VVGGSNLASQCLQAELLDEIQVHIVTILLGDGVRLFEDAGQVALELIRNLAFPRVTRLMYRVRANDRGEEVV